MASSASCLSLVMNAVQSSFLFSLLLIKFNVNLLILMYGVFCFLFELGYEHCSILFSVYFFVSFSRIGVILFVSSSHDVDKLWCVLHINMTMYFSAYKFHNSYRKNLSKQKDNCNFHFHNSCRKNLSKQKDNCNHHCTYIMC